MLDELAPLEVEALDILLVRRVRGRSRRQHLPVPKGELPARVDSRKVPVCWVRYLVTAGQLSTPVGRMKLLRKRTSASATFMRLATPSR